MSSIIEKIAKLRAKAEDDSLTEEEAALFAEKVAELMAKHKISELAGEVPKEDVTEWLWQIVYCDPWRRAVARGAAHLYFCDIYTRQWYDTESRRVRWGIVFVGRPEYIHVAHSVSEYLIRTTTNLGLTYSKTHLSETKTKRATLMSFERGMGYRLARRLEDKVKERSKPVEGDQLPAIYGGEQAANQEFMAKLNLRTTRLKGRPRIDKAFLAGTTAADQVSLDPQIEESE